MGSKSNIQAEIPSLICGMNYASALRYLELRRMNDASLYELNNLGELLMGYDLGVAESSVMLSVETLAWIGEYVCSRAINVISNCDDHFAYAADVRVALEGGSQ